MPLDPQAQALLDQWAALDAPPLRGQTAAEARVLGDVVDPTVVPEPVAALDERAIPGPAGEVPARIYTPEGRGPLPILVYFHGGGWVLGTLDTHDAWCRHLANSVPCIVVSVGYRLAPERPFPAAVEDCRVATEWVAAQAATFGGDPARIAVGGDSAGGNLAAVVARQARDDGGPALVAQVLICPVTDYHDAGLPSYRDNAVGYGLMAEEMVWFFDHYLPPETDRDDPRAFPLRAPDLGALPPALVVTAEYDVLRDEGERYAMRLRTAGTPVELRRYDGMIHNFPLLYDALDRGKDAVGEIVAALRTAFR